MHKNNKLIFVINSLHFGGAERVVSQLINSLHGDFEIHLALYHRVIDYKLPDTVKIIDLNEDEKNGNARIFLRLPLIAYKLKKYCSKHDIGIVVTFLNRPCYIAAIMKSWWNYKGRVVMCERSYQSNILNVIGGGTEIYKKISKKLIRFSYQRADLVLTNSMLSRLDLINNFSITTPVEVIYNPIDLQEIEDRSGEAPHDIFDKDFYYFISVGNFRPEKRFDILLKAMGILKQYPLKLILIGGGKLGSELKKLAEETGISDRIIFTGFDSNPYKYISRADCFVLSSYTEGFPNVLLEALACNKAVISTDCKSGPRELLAPGVNVEEEINNGFEVMKYGVLTAVNDAESLADAMLRLFNDKTLQQELSSIAFERAAMFNKTYISELYRNAFIGNNDLLKTTPVQKSINH